MPRSRLDPEETAALDELLARVRLLLLIASIGWAVYGVQYLLGGRWPGVLHLGAAVVTFGLRTRATARSSRASLRFLVHAAAAASFLMVLAQALLTGQERSAALWFFVTVPLFAIYTLSSRAAIAWLGVATAGFVAVYASEYVVAIPPVVVVPAYEILVAQIALGALIIAAALAARLANERHVATIRAQSEELRIQASEVTRARDAALDAARVKSEFLAMMSHEIRTPLNAVIGMATLLADGELLEGQRESIEVIRVSAEALLAVVNDVLDLSKLEAEKLEIDAAPVDVARCVEEALDQVAGPARAKGIELGYEVANDVPPIVESDGPRLRQILVNLVGNGVKFTPSGSVTVHARARAIGERTELTFEVRDTGIGIDEARRDRLFRPFSQVDASTTREFGGTGLGLAISKKLCELLGGRIEVESAPGQGSTFRFSIMARPADRPSLVDPVLVGGRVLLVAEHARTARLLQRHATQAGCEAIVAASREDALAVLRSDQAIGCALVDLAGDEADEARFLDAIRAARPGLAVVVHARAAHPVGPNATVLAKPLKASRLREELAAALGQPAPPPARGACSSWTTTRRTARWPSRCWRASGARRAPSRGPRAPSRSCGRSRSTSCSWTCRCPRWTATRRRGASGRTRRSRRSRGSSR
jgi:signal transduction histidine kinase/CheY-like chemotaxis protein